MRWPGLIGHREQRQAVSRGSAIDRCPIEEQASGPGHWRPPPLPAKWSPGLIVHQGARPPTLKTPPGLSVRAAIPKRMSPLHRAHDPDPLQVAQPVARRRSAYRQSPVWVQADVLKGTVEDVAVLATSLGAADQRVVVIPNSRCDLLLNHTRMRSGVETHAAVTSDMSPPRSGLATSARGVSVLCSPASVGWRSAGATAGSRRKTHHTCRHRAERASDHRNRRTMGRRASVADPDRETL